MSQNLVLQSLVGPQLAEIKAGGHTLTSFTPPLPGIVNPDLSPNFVSQAACEVCGMWIEVQWESPHFRITGNLLAADECDPSLRQPAA